MLPKQGDSSLIWLILMLGGLIDLKGWLELQSLEGNEESTDLKGKFSIILVLTVFGLYVAKFVIFAADLMYCRGKWPACRCACWGQTRI